MMCLLYRMGIALIAAALSAPLCPAGHLPHRWGDHKRRDQVFKKDVAEVET
jgi:hypothetical protein